MRMGLAPIADNGLMTIIVTATITILNTNLTLRPPANSMELLERLERFLKEKVVMYKDTRNFPSKNSTARLSVHHAAGTLAARTSVRLARDVNKTKKLDGGLQGIQSWISEVAWRDFYRHVLCHWPYVW